MYLVEKLRGFEHADVFVEHADVFVEHGWHYNDGMVEP